MASLQYLVSRTLRPFRGHSAFQEALLFHDWEKTVGQEYARGYRPVEIYTQPSGKVLKLVTSSSGMATARYAEPILLQRINQFFGAKYISAIKTTQGQLKRAPVKQPQQISNDPNTLDEALQALAGHLGCDNAHG